MQSSLLTLFLSRFHLSPVTISENEMRSFMHMGEKQVIRANVVHLAVDNSVFFIFVPSAKSFNVVNFADFASADMHTLRVDEIMQLREQLAKNSEYDRQKNIRLMVDEGLRDYRSVIVPAGDGKTFQMWNTEELISIEEAQSVCEDIYASESNAETKTTDLHPHRNRDWYKVLQTLPSLPATTKQLLRLINRDDWKTEELISIIANDPVVSVRIMNTASSALFHHGGDVKNIQDAVRRVLGTNTALNMAMAISTARAFALPQAGILGVDNVSTCSMHVAVFISKLMERMPLADGLDKGQAYLIGLLSNIGLFVLGHLNPEAYKTLSRNYSNQPDKSLLAHTEQMFGITHMELARLVLRKWGMPDAVVSAIEHHANDDYSGKYQDYVYLYKIADRVLTTHGLSFAPDTEVPVSMLDALGISEDDIALALDEVILNSGEISHFAYQMCA